MTILFRKIRLDDMFIFNFKAKLDMIVLFKLLLNGSRRQRLLREQHELNLHRERSDKEIEACPQNEPSWNGSQRLLREKCEYGNEIIPILALTFQESFFSDLLFFYEVLDRSSAENKLFC